MLFGTPLGLSIGGYPVREFEYLLARYSGNRIPNFEDLSLVSLHANAMRFIIQLDYNSPHEHREQGLDLAVARANLDRLVQIIKIIDEYVQFCTMLGCREQINQRCS